MKGLKLKDRLGDDLFVEFKLSGGTSPLLRCYLYKKNNFTVFGLKIFHQFDQVYFKISTESLQKVSKWEESDWLDFARFSVECYNKEKTVSKSKIERDMEKMNNING